MAGNGVIGITAQIMESSDLGGKQNPAPNMSLYQRMAVGLQNAKKSVKKLVGNNGTGLLWMLLASSSLLRGAISSTMKLLLFGLDLILINFFPVIAWVIDKLSGVIDAVYYIFDNVGTWFKYVFNKVWTWIREAAITGWNGVADALGWEGAKMDGQAELDKMYEEKVYNDPLTQEQFETWAADPSMGLVKGGPIAPSYWEGTKIQNWEPPGAAYANIGGGDSNEEGSVSWIYEDGPPNPPGGSIDRAKVDRLVASGDIKLIDEELSEEDKDAAQTGFWSWTEDIEPFKWGDINTWIMESLGNITGISITKDDITTLLWGDWTPESNDGEEIMENLINNSIEGEVPLPPEKTTNPPGVGSPPGWLTDK